MRIEGYDVSHFNVLPSPAGFSFGIHKATEGTGFTDPSYGSRIGVMRSQGLIIGHYMFGRLSEPEENQVEHFKSVAKVQPGDFVVLDWEDTLADPWHGLTTDIANVGARLMQILALNYPNNRSLAYMNVDTLNNVGGALVARQADGLWIADPSNHYNGPRIMTQYSTAGNLDHDRTDSFVSVQAFKEWLNMSSPIVGFSSTHARDFVEAMAVQYAVGNTVGNPVPDGPGNQAGPMASLLFAIAGEISAAAKSVIAEVDSHISSGGTIDVTQEELNTAFASLDLPSSIESALVHLVGKVVFSATPNA